MSSGRLFPSFGLSLVLKELHNRAGQDLTAGILDLVRRSVELEHAHAMRVIETSLEKTAETLRSQISDRQDALDAWFEGLRDVEEMPRPQKMVEELSSLARLPLKLSNEQLRALGEDPQQAREDIQDLVSEQLSSLYASRMMIGIENRLGEPLGIKLEDADWEDLSADLLEATRTVLERQRERLVGENGQVARDIASMSFNGPDPDTSILQALLSLTQGARTVFDQRTHRQEGDEDNDAFTLRQAHSYFVPWNLKLKLRANSFSRDSRPLVRRYIILTSGNSLASCLILSNIS